MMNFSRFGQHVILFLMSCAIGHGENPEKTKRALVLTKVNSEFQLTIPNDYSMDSSTAYFEAPKNGKTYLYCQQTGKNAEQSFLTKSLKINFGTEFNDSKKCEKSAKPVFVKVMNPDKVKQIQWDSQEMELYHSGYMLKSNFMKKIGRVFHSSKTKPEYEDWSSDYKFVMKFETYYNIKIKQTVAVEYKLLSTNLPFHDVSYRKKLTSSQGKTKLRTQDRPIFTHADTDNYYEIFKSKMSEAWIQKLENTVHENSLITSSFVPTGHFPIPLWERATLFEINLLPMWRKPELTWRKVQKFTKIVAKHLGDLKVITGVTDTMTYSNEEVIDKYEFRLPKYLWSVYEFHKGDKAYGIIVVLNCNPFEKTDPPLCEEQINCENHGWLIGNKNYEEGEISCCEMNNYNFAKLKTTYLSWKEKINFDLNIWSDQYVKIREEFLAKDWNEEINYAHLL